MEPVTQSYFLEAVVHTFYRYTLVRVFALLPMDE